MNVANARTFASKHPAWRGGFAEDTQVPMTARAVCVVTKTIKESEALFKARKEELEAEGWVVVVGTVAKGLVVLELDREKRALSLQKRPNPPKEGLTT